MEFLPLNKWSGQGFGYVLYRTFVPSSASSLTIHGLKDYGMVRMCYSMQLGLVSFSVVSSQKDTLTYCTCSSILREKASIRLGKNLSHVYSEV